MNTKNDQELCQSPSATQLLLKLCEKMELFHTPDNDAFATIFINPHYETWAVNSAEFKRLITGLYYKATKRAPSRLVIQEALEVITAKAQYEGQEKEIFLRVAKQNDRIYIDLVDPLWRVVQITENGWTILDKSPVKFRRSRYAQALPTPVEVDSPAYIKTLRNYLNLEAESDFQLFISWLMATYNPNGPFPVLVLYGEQGSGKSTFIRIARFFTDPNTTPLRREPKNAEDLLVSANNNWVIAVDNVSHLSDWLSDDLCRLATGGGLSKRGLYSNLEEVVINAKRPIIINGIEEFVTRGDLADRTIMLNLPSITSAKRQTDDSLWLEIEGNKEALFGAICSAIAIGLKQLKSVNLKKLPRMADAWKWISATESAFGWERGSSVEVFFKNQVNASEIVLSSSPLYAKIIQFADDAWSGTAEELLNKLKLETELNEQRYLPANARSLSDKIRRIKPALADVGILVTMQKTSGSNSKRLIMFSKKESSDAIDASLSSKYKYAPSTLGKQEDDVEIYCEKH